MSQKIIRIHDPRRKPTRTYRDDNPIGVKMDMLKLRVLMLKALAELVMDMDEDNNIKAASNE